jgi:hypothetical protein
LAPFSYAAHPLAFIEEEVQLASVFCGRANAKADCGDKIDGKANESGCYRDAEGSHSSPLSSGAISKASHRAERSKERAIEIRLRAIHESVCLADEFFD